MDSGTNSYRHSTVTLGCLTLRKVLYAPKLGINLVSVRNIAKEFGSVTFDAESCIVSNCSGIPLETASFSAEHGLYQVNLPERTVAAAANTTGSDSSTATKRSQDDSGNEIRTTSFIRRTTTSQPKSILC